MTRSVVITGVGAVTPLGVGARTLHERWSAGVSGIEDGFGRAGEFEPKEHLSTKEVRRSDRFTQLALAAALEAVEDAGWEDGPPGDPDRTACVIGTGIGGIGTLETQHLVMHEQGAERISPLSIPLLMANAASGVVAMKYDLRGQSFGTVSACAAGAHAIGMAERLIRYGDADCVVTGGSEAAITPLATAAFDKMDALSDSGISRPFDRRRDGFVMGEGAGVLVLEELEGARARGATLYAEVLGYGASNDGHHMAQPEPEAIGVAEMMRSALRRADVSPERVGYINAHGTSTPLGDLAETKAIKNVFGQHAYELAVSSTKSMMGHTFGAAGAIEAMMCVLAIHDGVLPPTINLHNPDPECDLDYVPNEARETKVDVALSNAMGLGGHNGCVLLGRIE